MVGVWEHLRTMMIVSSKLGQSTKKIPLRTWWPGDWPAIAVTCALFSQFWSQHLKPIPAARICVVASNFPHDDGFQDSLSSVFKLWIFKSSHFSPCGRTLWRSKEDHRTTRLWPFSRGTAPKSRRRRRTSQCPFIAACATTLAGTGRIPEIYHQEKTVLLPERLQNRRTVIAPKILGFSIFTAACAVSQWSGDHWILAHLHMFQPGERLRTHVAHRSRLDPSWVPTIFAPDTRMKVIFSYFFYECYKVLWSASIWSFGRLWTQIHVFWVENVIKCDESNILQCMTMFQVWGPDSIQLIPDSKWRK
jgi:hypothetical protein